MLDAFGSLVNRRSARDTAPMGEHVIIDGNNLLFAMHEHAPIPNVGRETLVRIIERWASARSRADKTTLVFDGPVPRGGMAKQMSGRGIRVRFSVAVTADDVIVELIHAAKHPDRVRIVTSDKAIRLEARYRRCRHIDSPGFVAELFAGKASHKGAPGPGDKTQRPSTALDDAGDASDTGDKPADPSLRDTAGWLELFGIDPEEDEPFDGFDAMDVS